MFNKRQINRIKSINVGGYGGKDALIAEALGHNRVNAPFYDATSKDNVKWEYKKQKTCQWLDPYKFSQLTEKEKDINVLFFIHDGTNIKEAYQTTYRQLIKTMGYTTKQLKKIKDLYSLPCFKNRETQMKAKITVSEIRCFKKII